jgi:pSer/pThr/pTyr-binding forkhead associated (FHA) protein
MTALDSDILILILRLGFVGLLYFFLLQVVLALRRNLRKASEPPTREPAGDGRLAVVESEQPELIAGQFVELQPKTTIGRSAHNTISLDDGFVSGSHAVIVFRDRRWILEDLGSTNGTYVNHKPVEGPTPISYGDIIEIGRVKFKLVR